MCAGEENVCRNWRQVLDAEVRVWYVDKQHSSF